MPTPQEQLEILRAQQRLRAPSGFSLPPGPGPLADPSVEMLTGAPPSTVPDSMLPGRAPVVAPVIPESVRRNPRFTRSLANSPDAEAIEGTGAVPAAPPAPAPSDQVRDFVRRQEEAETSPDWFGRITGAMKGGAEQFNEMVGRAGDSDFARTLRKLEERRRAGEADAGLDEERRRARGQIDIAEGAGRIGQGFATLGGAKNAEGYRAEGLREKEKELADKIPASQRLMLKENLGIDIPKGTTFAQLSKMSPLVSRAVAGQQRQEFSERAISNREEAQRKVEEAREYARSKLPTQVVNQLKDQKNSLDALARIGAAKDKAPGEVGPVVGRINTLLSRWGASPPEVATLQAELSQALALYGRALSGAAISEREMRRLKEALPGMVTRGDTFDALLDRFRSTVQTDLNNTIDLHEANAKRPLTGLRKVLGLAESEPAGEGDFRAGDEVMYEGKKRLVKGVRPDGSLELE